MQVSVTDIGQFICPALFYSRSGYWSRNVISSPSQSDVHSFFPALRILRSIPKDALIKSGDSMKRLKNIMGTLIDCRKRIILDAFNNPLPIPPVMGPVTRFKSEYMQDVRLMRTKERAQA